MAQANGRRTPHPRSRVGGGLVASFRNELPCPNTAKHALGVSLGSFEPCTRQPRTRRIMRFVPERTVPLPPTMPGGYLLSGMPPPARNADRSVEGFKGPVLYSSLSI